MIDNVTHINASAHGMNRSVSLSQRHTQPGTVEVPEEQSAQYDFAAIFGAASDERNTSTPAGTTASPTSLTSSAAAAAAATATTTTAASADTATTTPAVSGSVTKPGIQALVSAIMDGSFQPTNVTDPAQLTEVTPWKTDTMPSFYYASDQTASQMAQLLGGTVVKMPAFGQNVGWSEPNANFIQLPNGQTFNAADVAYYARTGVEGVNQLTADITQTINEGAAWTNYYKNGGGQMPSFAMGYVGQAISGMDYPAGTVAADGTVINPAMQSSKTQGT